MVSIVQIGEVKKEPHVECLTNRAELLHQSMIEAGKVSILQRCHDGPRERHSARLNRIGGVFAPFQINLRKDIERVLHELGSGFEAGSDEGIVNFIEGARELLAGAASPLGAADEAHEFALGERHVCLGRPAVTGMLLDERDENLVCQRARLSELRIGTNDDILFRHSPVELDLLGVSRRPLGVVAEQRAGDAQQRVLHVEFVADDSRLGRGTVLLSGGHVLHDTAMKARPSLRCVERMWRARRSSWARTVASVRDWSRWQPAAKNTSRILEGLTLWRGFVEPDRPRLFGLCCVRHGATPRPAPEA